MRQQRAHEHLLENVRVQERFVLAPRLRAVARVNRKHFARDLFRHFEGEAEVLRSLSEELVPEFRGGELVKSEIAADRRENLAVLAQALGFESLFGETSARQVAVPAVDLSQPALVLPGTAADVDILRGQLSQTLRQVVARERVRFLEKRTYHDCAARK